jgi:cell division protein FtsZ
VSESADPDAHIIFGTVIDDSMKGEVKIIVIATGFTGHIDVLGTLAYEPAARPVASAERPSFVIPPRGSMPLNPDDLDIPAFLRDRR